MQVSFFPVVLGLLEVPFLMNLKGMLLTFSLGADRRGGECQVDASHRRSIDD
jgi:hypothetical protein